MKKVLITLTAIITIVTFGIVDADAFLYNFDVQVSYDAAALNDLSLQIAGFDMILSGLSGSNFAATVVPSYAGTWTLAQTGGFDFAGDYVNTFFPLGPGSYTLATITSDTILGLTSIDNVFNYTVAGDFPNGSFSAQLNQVPIPPTVLLLGAGLLGLVGIRRRVKS